jgi:aryl-alcohol dehydrogenase-like predicted oxidoreductase
VNLTGKLVLGTANFGVRYGLTGTAGGLREEDLDRICQLSRDAGVRLLDSAIAYKGSHEVIAKVFSNEFGIVTKLPSVPAGVHASTFIRQAVELATIQLQPKNIYGLLLHDSSQLLGQRGPDIFCELLEQREQGNFDRIGVSVYSPDEAFSILNRFDIDLIQIPFSAFDRRLVESGLLRQLKSASVEVHVRSIFLQGLLTMNSWPAPFDELTILKAAWLELCNTEGLTAMECSLAAVASELALDGFVVGVRGYNDLMEIIRFLKSFRGFAPDLSALPAVPTNLIDPRLWPAWS